MRKSASFRKKAKIQYPWGNTSYVYDNWHRAIAREEVRTENSNRLFEKYIRTGKIPWDFSDNRLEILIT